MKPYFTEASKSMKGKPEKYGLPSNEQIKKSVYAKCGKKQLWQRKLVGSMGVRLIVGLL